MGGAVPAIRLVAVPLAAVVVPPAAVVTALGRLVLGRLVVVPPGWSRRDLSRRAAGSFSQRVLVCDGHQGSHRLGVAAVQLVPQHGVGPAAGHEEADCLDLVYALAGVAHFAPARQVYTVRLVRALLAHLELLGATRPAVGAGEVADEGLLEVEPAVDAAGWQVVEPCAGGAKQHEGGVAHGPAL